MYKINMEHSNIYKKKYLFPMISKNIKVLTN